MNARPNIVLIHGAWADGSAWSGVIERLQADGYHVTAPQFPLTALADDVARLRQVLDLQDGPAIVAGHSYGGQVTWRSSSRRRPKPCWPRARPAH
jgi:pimeloyl-ACP methyl ester carboxylesterase